MPTVYYLLRIKFYILNNINYIQMTKRKNIVITGILGQDGQILSKILLKKNTILLELLKEFQKIKKIKSNLKKSIY